MNTRTIVTVMAAAFLSVSLVSVSVAQDNMKGAQEGIEIITIIGKRPAPVTPSVSGVVTSANAAVETQSGDRNVSNEVLKAARTNMNRSTHTGKHHSEQSASASQAQI
jgi:hypothetical protein